MYSLFVLIIKSFTYVGYFVFFGFWGTNHKLDYNCLEIEYSHSTKNLFLFSICWKLDINIILWFLNHSKIIEVIYSYHINFIFVSKTSCKIYESYISTSYSKSEIFRSLILVIYSWSLSLHYQDIKSQQAFTIDNE